MDLDHLDHLARAVASTGTRRAALRLLAALPLAGGLLGHLDPADTGAKDRRRRRKQRHNRRKSPGSHKHTGCRPKGRGKVCAGTCGPVTSRRTCGKMVDCGPCPCDPPCTACSTCDATIRTCVSQCSVTDTCCTGDCADFQTDANHCGACGAACAEGQACQGGICGVVCGSDFCPAASEVCDAGACHACDVCPSGTCAFATVQAAIDAAVSGDTLYVCAGAYPRAGSDQVAAISGKDLTLVGAGTGTGGSILSGDNVGVGNPVASLFQSTSEFRNLTVTGSNGNASISVSLNVTLTLTGVLVTGNTGGIYNNDHVVLNSGTTVTGNRAATGSGIFNNIAAVVTLKAGSRVIANTASGDAPGFTTLASSMPKLAVRWRAA